MALAAALLCGAGGAARADSTEQTREHMQGLDEQDQEIESDVLRIASELRLLEEELLYPSNTHVAVFVSLADGGEDARLDVSVAGKTAGGGDFGEAETFSFAKDAEPKLVDIRLAGGGSGGPSIRLGR